MIDVEIEDDAWSVAVADAREAVLGAVAASLAVAQSSARSLVVLLTGDADMAELNGRFRQKAGPTNVLSFPAPANFEDHLGDIALGFGVCSREAELQAKAIRDHMQHLVAHGVLHLLGYDHETDAQAEVMETLERQALMQLGVDDPYGDQNAHG